MKLKQIMIIATIVVLILFFTVVVALFIGFANEDKYLKQELDNYYINNNFSNWKQIEIANKQLSVPDNWILENNVDYYKVLDENDNTLAYVLTLKQNGNSADEILASILDCDIKDINYQSLSDVISINGSEFSKVQIQSEDQNTLYYVLKLGCISDEYILKLLFPNGEALSYEDIVEISQAIAYAYAFRGQTDN